MISIEWTSPAFAQLEVLPEKLAFEIVERVDLLATFPKMGTSLESSYPALNDCRQLIIGRSYRVVYGFDEMENQIWVLAVQYCRQRLPSARELKRRKFKSEE